MVKDKSASEIESYMRINPLKNNDGEESVTLRLVSKPEFCVTKDRPVIKFKFSDSNDEDKEQIYCIVK